MVILNAIKSMVDTALSKKYAEGILTLEFAMSEENYKRNLYCSKQRIINPEYSFKYKGVMTKRPFEEWVDIPHAFKNGTINTFFVAMDLNEVRRSHEVFYDANELVSLRPSAPEQFLVISLSINSDKCTLCPQEYNKNEILRYFQVRKIWNILSSCADGANGRELVYLYKNKIDVSFLYTYEDLSFEFDGLAKLESIFADPLHKEEKKQILQNVLFSFLWRERKDSRFPKLLRDFTVFATMFHESYLAFTVGFNFDKVRKEYQEKFRDYLSKLNAVLHDVLTRSLAIPVSGIISFAAMGKSMDLNSGVINLAAIALSIYTTFTIHFLANYQKVIIDQCGDEFKEIFNSLRDELKGLELIDLNQKEQTLNLQCSTILKVLSFVSALSFTNLILNGLMYANTFIK